MAASKSTHQSNGASQSNQRQVITERSSTLLPFVTPSFLFGVGDPQEGNLATPINSSRFTRWFINQLPAYRQGLSPFQRGLQIGLSHGFWLLGPFVALGPLRDTGWALFAGLFSTIGVVAIAVLALSAYAASAPPPPIATLTTPQPPTDLSTPQGWNAFSRGFLYGGMSGAVFAAVLLFIYTL
ncbi:MAG: photosystem I reaction center subunit XI [Leptolyngbya sp. BL-A-14]